MSRSNLNSPYRRNQAPVKAERTIARLASIVGKKLLKKADQIANCDFTSDIALITIGSCILTLIIYNTFIWITK